MRVVLGRLANGGAEEAHDTIGDHQGHENLGIVRVQASDRDGREADDERQPLVDLVGRLRPPGDRTSSNIRGTPYGLTGAPEVVTLPDHTLPGLLTQSDTGPQPQVPNVLPRTWIVVPLVPGAYRR